MPFNPDNPPARVKDLPKNKQRQFCEVWNSVFKKTHDEGKAFSTAYGVVKKSSDNEIIGPSIGDGALSDNTINKDLIASRELLKIARSVLGEKRT